MWGPPSEAIPLQLNNASLLIGTFLNLMVYTLVLGQAYEYYVNGVRTMNDKLVIKLGVALNLLSDTVGSASACALIFLYTVPYWGDTAKAQQNQWPLIVVLFTTALNALVVQSFMVHRYFKMSRNFFVTVLLTLLVLLGFSSMFRNAVASARHTSLAKRYKQIRYITVGLSGAVLADIGITIALLWELRRFSACSRATAGLLQRISLVVIKSGTIPSLFAVASLVAYLVRPESQVSVTIFLLLGRVYTSTMLFTLNSREKIRGEIWIHTGSTGVPQVLTSPGAEKDIDHEIVFARRSELDRTNSSFIPSVVVTAPSISPSTSSALEATGELRHDTSKLELSKPPPTLAKSSLTVRSAR